MILRRLPHPDGRRADYEMFGRRNVLIHAEQCAAAYGEHTAPLSIKTSLRGRETYYVDGVPVAVEPGTYLILNDEQPYASTSDADDPVASFCLFFRSGLADEVMHARQATAEAQLDDPHARPQASFAFFSHLRRGADGVASRLRYLHAHVAGGKPAPTWLDEQCHALILAMLDAEAAVRRDVAALPATRPATRHELFRRLHRARDFIDASYAETISLADVAGVACLSEHYFLRLFARVFGTTPHQYLTERRLRAAATLLAGSGESIAQICLAVGFHDPSSFGQLFKRRYGCTPTEHRRRR